MSAYAYPYDPRDPRASYYGPPPTGYPGAPPNGYPHPPPGAPQSPQSPPPGRPQTGASYPSPSQYAPPPAQALYYGMPPPQAGGAPPPASGGGPPPSAYAPPTPPSTAPGPATTTATAVPQFSGISQEQLQQMMAAFASLKAADSKPSSAPAPAESAPAPAPAPDSPPVPRIDTSMSPFSHYDIPPSSRGPPVPAHYPYPAYGYYGRPGPPSHNGEAPPPPAPAPPPKPAHASPSPAPPAPSKTPGPMMPGAFGISEAPVRPPTAPPPPARTPAPSGSRPDNARKASGISEMSFGSNKSHDREMGHAWEQWGGQLVEVQSGREPRPKPKLVALFRGIAAYMITLLEPAGSCVVTLNKLIQFYQTFPAGLEEEKSDQDYWHRFFNTRSPKVLSELFCALNVEHHLVPTKPNQPPTIPGLTPRGFEVWMFTQLMAAPTREWIRLSKILEQWTILDGAPDQVLPKLIPRECFPPVEDRAIYEGWWQAVTEDFPSEDSVGSDDEHRVPLSLPAPEKPRRRGYSIRGGELPVEAAAPEEDPKESPPPAPPSLTRKRTNRPYSMSKPYPPTGVVPDPHDFLTPEEKGSSPDQRFHHPYGDAAPAPGWREEARREDINPRPTLGEENARPPTRSRSVKPKGSPVTTATATKDSSSRRPSGPATKRGRSTHRRRGESPDRCSDDEDYDQAKYDGYSKRYEGDGLYEDTSPPTRTTTPHHPSYHRRDPSRGPPLRTAEKDIREYTYADQYDKDYASPTVSASGRRPHRGSDAYLHHSSRKGPWR